MKRNKKCQIDFDLPELFKISTSCRTLLLAMLEVDPNTRITPEVALEHEYFAEFSKYKTFVSLGELESSGDHLSDSECQVEEKHQKTDLAQLMQVYKGKQNVSSSF